MRAILSIILGVLLIVSTSCSRSSSSRLDPSSISNPDLAACARRVSGYITDAHQWESNLPRVEIPLSPEQKAIFNRMRGSGVQMPTTTVDYKKAPGLFTPLAKEHWIGGEWRLELGSYSNRMKHDPATEWLTDVQRVNEDVIEVFCSVPSMIAHQERVERIYRLEQDDDQWRIRRYFDQGPKNLIGHKQLVPKPPAKLTPPARPTIPTEISNLAAAPVRTAVRLRPYPDERVKTASSHMGGRFLGNATDTWPACEHHNTPMIGILQIRKDDVADLPFRGDESVFQLMWCPFNHMDFACPLVQTRWLTDEEAIDSGTDNPEARRGWHEYAPRTCRFYPHKIDELPNLHWKSFEKDARQLVDWLRGQGEYELDEAKYGEYLTDEPRYRDMTLHRLLLGPSIGTKVGGYPDWIQDEETPICEHCSEPMTHLLTVASADWDGGAAGRFFRPRELPDHLNYSLAGLMLGDVGDIYVFICLHCKQRHIKRVFQCS